MRRLQKVLWTKGTLLNPQHLQLQDGYLEDLLAFRIGTFQRPAWGFGRLEIDPDGLGAGVLSVVSASGIFPDGLPFIIPGADGPPAPKALLEHWRADQRSMDVFLAVPEYRPGGHNVSIHGDARHTRYIAEAVIRADENTGMMEKPLQLARRNLRLVAEGESREGYSVLQVARVVRAESEELRLDPRYVPPVLDVAASGQLKTIARGMLEILTARSSSLAGTRKQRNRALASFDASDVASFWLLYTVNSHLPAVRHHFESRTAHPEELYEALLDLASALTSFSDRIHPRDLPAYDHAALGDCFGHLDTIIRELLETVVPRNHVVLPLKQTEPFLHAVALDDERLLGGSQIFLGIRTATAAEEVARRGPLLLKVAAAEQVERLIRHALPGVPVRYIAVPPARVPVKVGYHYFELDRTGSDWESVRTARNLAAYVPSDFVEPQLELVVMLASPASDFSG